MNEFCGENDLYRTTFLVRNAKRNVFFSEPRRRRYRQRYLNYICDDPLYIIAVGCFSFYIIIY